jgi:release factor glutamine methyltransferase
MPSYTSTTSSLQDALMAAGIPAAEALGEARLITCHALNITRTQLFLRENTPFSPSEWESIAPLLHRRIKREPLAYIIGTRGFYGLDFRVTPAVLIPRPETELLVELAISRVPENATIADIGTGSGCIAVAIAKNRPDLTVFAADISEEALTIAKENAITNGVTNITFCHGNLCEALPIAVKFAAILSNPPYIAPEEIANLQPEIRDFEPHLALGTHSDPLEIYRNLATQAREKLLPGGLLIVEVGAGQAQFIAPFFEKVGYREIDIQKDYGGIERVVSGIKAH